MHIKSAQETGWSTATELAHIALVLAVFGFAALPITHLAARLFTVPTAGYTLLTIIYIVTGLLFATLVTALGKIQFTDTADTLTWLFQLMPHFSLNACLRHMQRLTQRRQVCEIQCGRLPLCSAQTMCTMMPRCCEGVLFDFEAPGIATPLVYMAMVGAATIVLNLLIEFRIFDRLWYAVVVERRWWCGGRRAGGATAAAARMLMIPPPGVSGEAIDADVLNERNRVYGMSAFEGRSHALVVRDMSKMYGRFCGVNRLALAVDG